MTTRGWTPRAASSDPHDFRGAVHGDLADRWPAAAPVELRVKLRSSFDVPCHVVNTRPVSTQPSPACLRSVSCRCLQSLSAATHRSGRGSGASDPSVLAGPSQELPTDALELLAGHAIPRSPASRTATSSTAHWRSHGNRSSKPVVCETPRRTLQPRQP